MRAHDAKTRVVGHTRWNHPGGHSAVAHHDVSAGRGVPRLALAGAREASVHQALRHDLGGVVGRRGVEEEVLIVHGVRVDGVQF